ncbi:hypothetical protein C8Q75DRAFT_786590, partial [Abortiporus biennis]
MDWRMSTTSNRITARFYEKTWALNREMRHGDSTNIKFNSENIDGERHTLHANTHL